MSVCVCVCVFTQNCGGGQQLGAGDPLPGVGDRVGALAGLAAKHHILAHLCGPLSIAARLRGSDCRTTEREGGRERAGERGRQTDRPTNRQTGGEREGTSKTKGQVQTITVHTSMTSHLCLLF